MTTLATAAIAAQAEQIQLITDREAATIVENWIPGQCSRIFCENGRIVNGLIANSLIYARAGAPEMLDLKNYIDARIEAKRLDLVPNWLDRG